MKEYEETLKNIIKEYPWESIFKEFLQNADDAGAHRFCVYLDYRDERQKFDAKGKSKSLLTPEMDVWQGPAVWIYNDEEFSESDFHGLIKLGLGNKAMDESKIGRFGVGFNTAYHLTDLPSLVSGEKIIFLDPSKKYLPPIGNPPQRRNGDCINFVTNPNFRNQFSDQLKPYSAIQNCTFESRFPGTLFRLPLRTAQVESKICTEKFKIDQIRRKLDAIGERASSQLIFLRNIESFQVFEICSSQTQPQQIWTTKLNMSEELRHKRSLLNYDNQTLLQFSIETMISRIPSSESWLVCNGGNSFITHNEMNIFAKEHGIPAVGGVALLLAKDKVSTERPPTFPKINGELYSYLPLSRPINLPVHINGAFALTFGRADLVQMNSDSVEARWNKYMFDEILPPLYTRILEEIVKLYVRKEDKENNDAVLSYWSFPRNNKGANYIRDFGFRVIERLLQGHPIFRTNARNGAYISLKDAYIAQDESESMYADILAANGVLTVKLPKDQIDQLKQLRNDEKIRYRAFSQVLVREILRRNAKAGNEGSLDEIIQENGKFHKTKTMKLLEYILNDLKGEAYNDLIGIPLVPLCNGTFGTFGNTYYIAKPEERKLFPTCDSLFVGDLPSDISKIFTHETFQKIIKIKKLDTDSIRELLQIEFANSLSISDRRRLDSIWRLTFE